MKNAHQRAIDAARKVYGIRQRVTGTNACFKFGIRVETGETEYAVNLLTPWPGNCHELKICYSGDDMIRHLLSKNLTMLQIAECFEWMLGVHWNEEAEHEYAEKGLKCPACNGRGVAEHPVKGAINCDVCYGRGLI